MGRATGVRGFPLASGAGRQCGERALQRCARPSAVTGSCRDEKTQTQYGPSESWLRPGLRGNRVEYCRCAGGRPQCHSVPVRGTCPPTLARRGGARRGESLWGLASVSPSVRGGSGRAYLGLLREGNELILQTA